jgi:hypothetical protein
MPAKARSGPKEAPVDVLKRVKVIEDFAGPEDTVAPGSDGPLGAEPTMVDAPRHGPLPADTQPVSAERVEAAVSGPRRMITEERNIALIEGAKKRWIPIVAGCALLATAVLLVEAARSPTPQAPVEAIRPRVRPPQAVFKHPPPEAPPLAPLPRPESASPEPVRPPPPAPVAPKSCYVPPKQGLGYVAVASDRPISVKVDGDAVCGPHAKIPVMVGFRRITVVDTRTGEEYVKPVRIETNQLVPVVPTFRGH